MKLKTTIGFVINIGILVFDTSCQSQNNIAKISNSEQVQLSLNLNSENRISSVDLVDEYFTQWDNDNSPGFSVAILQEGDITLRKDYGMANLELGIPIGSKTVFDVASLAKQFTAFAVAILVDEGRVLLTDNISTHIPEFPKFEYNITIDHLIHHTSGLRDWATIMFIQGLQMDDVITFDQVLNMLYLQKDLNFVPGTEYSYSNTGYVVLAELVQRVSGISFRQWTDSVIFKPLGMTNTHFQEDHTLIVPHRATGYLNWDEQFHNISNNTSVCGSSSLLTTMDDFIKWNTFLYHSNNSKSPGINHMFERGKLNNGELISYAFGLGIGDYHGMQKIAHNGSWAGFKTYSGHIKDEQFTLIIFSNDGSVNISKVGADLQDIYLKDKWKPEQKSNELNDAKSRVEIVEHIDRKQEDLTEYQGLYYSDELETSFNLMIHNGQLVATHNRIDNISLSIMNPDNFQGSRWFFSNVEFIRNSENKVTGCKISSDRARNLFFTKLN